MLKVQLCSGTSRIPGFKNHDRDADITKRLPYDDNAADEVRCEHGAEHQTTHQCLRFFDEVRRILKPGGTFRVCCPVLDRLNVEEARDIVFNHGHETFFSTDSLYHLLRSAGFTHIQPTERDEFDHHHTVIGKEKDDKETARFICTK